MISSISDDNSIEYLIESYKRTLNEGGSVYVVNGVTSAVTARCYLRGVTGNNIHNSVNIRCTLLHWYKAGQLIRKPVNLMYEYYFMNDEAVIARQKYQLTQTLLK